MTKLLLLYWYMMILCSDKARYLYILYMCRVYFL